MIFWRAECRPHFSTYNARVFPTKLTRSTIIKWRVMCSFPCTLYIDAITESLDCQYRNTSSPYSGQLRCQYGTIWGYGAFYIDIEHLDIVLFHLCGVVEPGICEKNAMQLKIFISSSYSWCALNVNSEWNRQKIGFFLSSSLFATQFQQKCHCTSLFIKGKKWQKCEIAVAS